MESPKMNKLKKDSHADDHLASTKKSPIFAEALNEALLDAYSVDSFEQMLFLKFKKKPGLIATGNLKKIIFEAIRTSDEEGWQEDLALEAHSYNPGNKKLKAFINQHLNHKKEKITSPSLSHDIVDDEQLLDIVPLVEPANPNQASRSLNKKPEPEPELPPTSKWPLYLKIASIVAVSFFLYKLKNIISPPQTPPAKNIISPLQIGEYDHRLKELSQELKKLQAKQKELQQKLKAVTKLITGIRKASSPKETTSLDRRMSAATDKRFKLEKELKKNSQQLAAIEKKIKEVTVIENTADKHRWCYQENDLKKGTKQYSVHCHKTIAKCKSARGPNTKTQQSECMLVKMDQTTWKLNKGGWGGAWYKYNAKKFPSPFPQLPKS